MNRVPFLLFLALLLAVTGCSKNTKPVPHVGILLFGEARQPQVNGFTERMAELGYRRGETIRYTILSANGDRAALPGLVADLRAINVDLMVAAGGLEADAMKAQPTGGSPLPVVVLYVNAIMERGLVQSRVEPGWPVTGVDNLNAELSGKRVELIHDLLPEAQRILMLYIPDIEPSRMGLESARETAAKLGLTIDDRPVDSQQMIYDIMTSLHPGEVDVMLIGTAAPMANALRDVILPRARNLRLPVFAHSRPQVELGALAAYGASFSAMGRLAARLADKVLRGVDVGSIPFETPERFVYSLNAEAQERLGVTLSDVVKAQINDYVAVRGK
jgi:putative ABC transport system substrate-binding protein